VQHLVAALHLVGVVVLGGLQQLEGRHVARLEDLEAPVRREG
jgi:hypothetical protein